MCRRQFGKTDSYNSEECNKNSSCVFENIIKPLYDTIGIIYGFYDGIDNKIYSQNESNGCDNFLDSKAGSHEQKSAIVSKRDSITYFFLFTSFFLTIARGAVIPFLAIYITTAFDKSITTAGFALSVSSVVGIFLSLYASRLTRARNAWLSILILITLFLSSLCLGALSNGIVVLTALMVMMNFSYSCIEILLKTYISCENDVANKKRFFSNNYFLINIGWAIGPLLGMLAQKTHLNFIFYAGTFVSLMPLAWLIIRADTFRGFTIQPLEENDEPSLDEDYSSKGIGLSSWRLTLLTLASFLGAFVYGNPIAYLSQYLIHDYSEQTVSSIVAILMVTNALVVLLFQGYIIRKISHGNMLRFLMGATIFFVIGVVIFYHAGESRIAWILGMFFFALGEVIFVPSLFIITDLIAPKNKRGNYFSVQNLGAVGAAVSPFAMGYIISEMGSVVTFSFLGIVVMLSFILIFFMKINQLNSMKQIRQA